MDVSADSTLIGADGVRRIVEVDHAGEGGYDHSTGDRTVVAADGSRTETIIGVNFDRSETSAITIAAMVDARTRTFFIDFDGDGTLDRVVVAQSSANSDGAVITATTTSFDGNQSAVLGTTAPSASVVGRRRARAWHQGRRSSDARRRHGRARRATLSHRHGEGHRFTDLHV